MADIVMQPLEERYLDEYCNVLSLTYRNGDPIPDERRFLDRAEFPSYVALQDGAVVGGLSILLMNSTRGEAIIPCAGVAGVAVLPELRRTGVGSQMISWLNNELHRIQIPLACLYPFRETFYRRFGYELAGRRLKIKCPTHRWPKLEISLPVRRLKPAAWEELVDCYGAFAHRRSGLNVRTEYQWKRVLAENRELTIYAVGEPVEAYAVVSHQASFWTSDHISEIAWSTRRGYESMLAALGGLGINKESLSWYEPLDGPFYFELMDQGVETKLDRTIMYRVTDVPGALRLLKPDPRLHGEFTLGIDDHGVSENTGPWLVQFDDGEVQVKRQKDGTPLGITMSIRHFAQALLGEPSLAQLVADEYVEAKSQTDLAMAVSLLTPMATYCMDYF